MERQSQVLILNFSSTDFYARKGSGIKVSGFKYNLDIEGLVSKSVVLVKVMPFKDIITDFLDCAFTPITIKRKRKQLVSVI